MLSNITPLLDLLSRHDTDPVLAWLHVNSQACSPVQLETLLLVASAHATIGTPDIIHALVKAGVDVKTQYNQAFNLACSATILDYRTLKTLLHYGASLEPTACAHRNMESPLSRAQKQNNLELLRWLVRQGLDLNPPASTDITQYVNWMQQAISGRQYDFIQEALRLGLDVHTQDGLLWKYSLQHTLWSGNTQFLQLLQQHNFNVEHYTLTTYKILLIETIPEFIPLIIKLNILPSLKQLPDVLSIALEQQSWVAAYQILQALEFPQETTTQFFHDIRQRYPHFPEIFEPIVSQMEVANLNQELMITQSALVRARF